MAEADDVEFSDTPYAASFALFNQAKPEDPVVKTEPAAAKQQLTPLEDDSRQHATTNIAAAPTEFAVTERALEEASEINKGPDTALADVVQQTLAEIQAAKEIPLEKEQEWQALLMEIIEPMRSIQSQWRLLEKEYRCLIKPPQAAQPSSSAGYTAYAGRGRGRGRARGRGRYRGRP